MKYIIYAAHLLLKKPKGICKALLLLTLFPLVDLQKGNAQTPMELASQELRSLFQNISNPHPDVRFFYDLSAHVVDSQFFDDHCPDTINNSLWYSLYEEMWWMAYDTASNQKVINIINQASGPISRDTIPIGIMDWNYNLLKPDALTTGTYFIFDTVNHVLYDKPGAPNPFTIQTTFAAAPLALTSSFLNTVFSIRPQFMFKDVSYKGNNWDIRINFDDGTGWHTFHDMSAQNYVANYASSGAKTIRSQIYDNSNNIVLKESISEFVVIGNTISTTPDDIIYTDDITATIYHPPGCTPGAERKYVIYLEGYDPIDSRSNAELYEDMIVAPQIVQLKNQGYSFIVVNWENGSAPIQTNANAVRELLEFLICDAANNGSTLPPFVIVAESMGGLVARYALCDMERPNYRRMCPGPAGTVPHNTRLLITIDAPHQGANVPIGLQYLYHYVASNTLNAMGLAPLLYRDVGKMYTVLGGAASQMLIYHVGTDIALPIPVSNNPIYEHPNKTAFDAELEALGNYPRLCKLVATSNGSWVGERQRQPYGTFNLREPNDIILRMNAETVLRILGIRIAGTAIKLTTRTNPDGDGNVFDADLGVSHWKIKLRWFGVRLDWHTQYLVKLNKSVKNVRPYCVMPASRPGVMDIGNNADTTIWPNPNNGWNVLIPFGFTSSSTGNGDLAISAHLAHPVIGGLYADVEAFSNGADFGFIHPYSSFDFDHGGAPLDQPILENSVNVADIMDRTPFHVVYTNPTIENRNHLNIRLHNSQLNIYNTCLSMPNGDNVRSRLINREIGDDTLWLENFTAAYPGIIEAEREILINERNIYYNYPTGFSSFSDRFSADNFPDEFDPVDGAVVLSKEASMVFAFPGLLQSNDNITVSGTQPPIGSFSWNPGSMINCCIAFSQRPGHPVEEKEATQSHQGYLQLYPNPAGGRLTIKFQLNTNTPATIYVYNPIGQLVKIWHPGFTDQTKHCYYNVPENEMKMPPGMYYVLLQAGSENHHAQLIIK